MHDALITFLQNGLLDASWWTIGILFLLATQLTIFAVTLYLHRCQAHRAADLHPLVSHVFRFWLWMSTAMVTREWVAVHRKHHARCETDEDPHSPVTRGIRKVFWEGVELYIDAKRDPETLSKYGAGTPDDWLERNIYSKNSWIGPTLLWFITFFAFGVIGIAFWAIQMAWIPFFAAGVVNGLGHWVGYRNFATEDASHNLVPWGLWIGGEELHNNHHAFPSSARFALRSYEVDAGWWMLCAMEKVGLARIRRVAPMLAVEQTKDQVDLDTIRAVMATRCQVLSDYFRHVVQPVVQEEAHKAGASISRWRRNAKRWILGNGKMLDATSKERLNTWLSERPSLAVVCEYRQRLKAVWERSYASNDALIKALQDWCHEAEATGVRALQDFSARIRSYSLQPARVSA